MRGSGGADSPPSETADASAAHTNNNYLNKLVWIDSGKISVQIVNFVININKKIMIMTIIINNSNNKISKKIITHKKLYKTDENFLTKQ